MNRIEKVREYVDDMLLKMTDAQARRDGYLHLYGVAQGCAMIALKRGLDPEMATVAGMLHDVATYSTMDSRMHAHRGAVMAREILAGMGIFEAEEIETVCHAIHCHSDKASVDGPMDELLKDADVMQHCLYDPLAAVLAKETQRYEALKREFGIA